MLVFVVPVTEERLQHFIINKPVDLRSLFVWNCSSGDCDEDLGLERSGPKEDTIKSTGQNWWQPYLGFMIKFTLSTIFDRMDMIYRSVSEVKLRLRSLDLLPFRIPVLQSKNVGGRQIFLFWNTPWNWLEDRSPGSALAHSGFRKRDFSILSKAHGLWSDISIEMERYDKNID